MEKNLEGMKLLSVFNEFKLDDDVTIRQESDVSEWHYR